MDLPNAVLFSIREDTIDDVMAMILAVTAQVTIVFDTCL